MKFLAFFFCFFCLTAQAQQSIIPVIIDGDEVVYSKENEVVAAKGNVSMKYQEIVLTCESASYDVNNNTADIDSEFVITSKEGIMHAASGVYDFNTKTATLKKIRLESEPYYGKADTGEKISENEYLLRRGYLSTCEYEKPHYKLTARTIRVYPGDRVIASNMILKIGAIPVFYFPYYSHSLKEPFPVEVIPGKGNDWGFDVLSRWKYHLVEGSRGKVHLDWYETRGWGSGVTHKLETGKFGQALIKYYTIDDEIYGASNRNELLDIYPDRSGIDTKYLDSRRYKGEISYSWQPDPALAINAEFHKFSDEYFMKDFFYREYEREAHPYSYFLMDYSFNNSSLSLFTQKRANHFFAETEYLPQLEYNFYRQRMAASPFYFESTLSAANLITKSVHSAADTDANRLYSHSVVSYPTNIVWLSITPYAGMYSAYYSKNIDGDQNIWRQAPEAGVSLSTKLYKYFSGGFDFLGERVDHFRHLLTPILEYSYIHSPTVANGRLGTFDSLDDLSRKEAVIFTLENKLQAKNESRGWDYLYFAPSFEYKIDQEGTGSFFDNFKTKLEFYPNQFFSLASDTTYDCLNRSWSEANVDVGFRDTKNKRYNFSFGHRYARDESSQSTLSFTYQLTSKVQFKNYLRYEHRTGDFKEQQYFFRRDLHCWWMDFGIDVDNNKNIGFWIIFRIKAFPEAQVGFNHTYEGSRQEY